MSEPISDDKGGNVGGQFLIFVDRGEGARPLHFWLTSDVNTKQPRIGSVR